MDLNPILIGIFELSINICVERVWVFNKLIILFLSFRLVEELKQKCDIVLTNEDVYMNTEYVFTIFIFD